MADRSVDILIIGGGVIGVCTAYYLLQQGRSVTLLDKDDICAGSSYGNGGLVVPSHAMPLAMPGAIGQALKWLFDPTSPFYIKPRLDRALFDWLWRFRAASNTAAVHKAIPVLLGLNLASLKLFREIASCEGLDFNFEHRGGLYLFTTQSGLQKGIHEAELLHSYGCQVAILDASGVRQWAPASPTGRDGRHLLPRGCPHHSRPLCTRAGRTGPAPGRRHLPGDRGARLRNKRRSRDKGRDHARGLCPATCGIGDGRVVAAAGA